MSFLDAEALQKGCAENGLPWRVRVEESVSSTSDVLRQLGQEGEASNLVLFAEYQTQGRGRRDNRWLMPRGKDLMVSFLLRPASPPETWPRLTTLAALAICRAIEQELPLQPQIKWPNDIYVNDRKVSGLLAEITASNAVILGIGLNVNTREFPEEIAASATSLLREVASGHLVELDRTALALALLTHLHHLTEDLSSGFSEAIAEVRERSWLKGKTIRAQVLGQELYGRVLDIDAEGHLLVALPDGSTAALSSAESVRQVL